MRRISKKKKDEMIKILKECGFTDEAIEHALKNEEIVTFLLKSIEGRKEEKNDTDEEHAPKWMIDDLLCRYQNAVIRAASDVLKTDTNTERETMKTWDLKVIAWMTEITAYLEMFNSCDPWTTE